MILQVLQSHKVIRPLTYNLMLGAKQELKVFQHFKLMMHQCVLNQIFHTDLLIRHHSSHYKLLLSIVILIVMDNVTYVLLTQQQLLQMLEVIL